MCDKADGNLVEVDKIRQRVTFNLRLEHVTQDSDPKDHQEVHFFFNFVSNQLFR